MKKITALLLSFIMLFASLNQSGVQVLSAAEAENLLSNGGFESLTTGAAWKEGIAPVATTAFLSSGSPVFAVDDHVKRSGERSVSLSATSVSRGAIVQEARGGAIAAGASYLLSGWVKTADLSNKAVLRYQAGRTGGNILINITELTGTNDWTYFSQVATLPDNITDPAWIKIEAFLENSTGTMWVDDFSIRRIVPLEKLDIQPDIVELNVGDSHQFTLAYLPENTTEREVLWSSSNEEVATVSQEGSVQALANGYARISVQSTDGTVEDTTIISVGAPNSLSVQDYTGMTNSGILDGRLFASDSAGAVVTFGLASPPRHGSVHVREDGTFSYYPNAMFSGEDAFIFMALTGANGHKFGVARITVQAVAKAPDLDLLWYSTGKGVPLTEQLQKVSDANPGGLVWFKKTEPAHGQLTISSSGLFVYTPNEGYVGYDSFEVSVEGSSGLASEGKVTIFVLPDEADFAAKLDDTGMAGQHPRLLADADRFLTMKQLIADGDPYMSQWYDLLKQQADAALLTSPLPHTSNGSNYGVMRDRLIQTALMYRISGEQRYAARAAAELEAIAAYPDWFGRSNNLLPLAELSYGVALAYDWIQDDLTAEQTDVIAEAIRVKSLGVALQWYRGEFRHNGEFNNINLVDNGGFALAALAIMDKGDLAETDAAEVLRGAYTKLQHALRFYTEDGAWLEGPAYWHYGGQYFTYMMAAMLNVLGTDYGLSMLPGVANSGEFPVHMLGEGGFFDFYDGGISMAQPESMWYADHYGEPQNAWHLGDLFRRKGVYHPLYLVFYKPGLFDTEPVALDRTFTGIESISMRSGWNDPNALFASMKGFNDTLLSHHDLDAGTFVFDGLGVRWAMDSGNEAYDLTGFWDYNRTRWTYYRKTAEGHNTLVVNPQENPVMQQQHNAKAILVQSDSKPRGAYGIIDMTERYPLYAVSMKRGIMLAGDREQLIVQDEMRFKKPSEVYWFMHTTAEIEIVEEGRAAILSEQDKKLYVKLIEAPEGTVFSEMAASPLPTSPNPEGQAMNHGIRKLALHMTEVEQDNLAVWMVPMWQDEAVPLAAPAFTALADWAIPVGELPPKQARPEVSGIEVNGQPLSGFDPKKTYYEIIVPFDLEDIPVIAAQAAVGEVDVQQAAGVPGRAIVEVTDPARPGIMQRYTVQFILGPIVGELPEVNKWPVVDVYASAVPEAAQGNTPDKTLDGNLDTRWAASGAQWIAYDLGELRQVGAVSIAYMNGNARNYYFDIQSSQDGVNWDTLFTGQSSGLTNEPELYSVEAEAARYIRINGRGNSSNNWNSVTEVAIFRPSPIYLRVAGPQTIEVGEEAELAATWSYADGRRIAAEGLAFDSSDPEVLEVDEAGRVTGRQVGQATVVVTDLEYGLQGSVLIEVTEAPEMPPGNVKVIPVGGPERGKSGKIAANRAATFHYIDGQTFLIVVPRGASSKEWELQIERLNDSAVPLPDDLLLLSDAYELQKDFEGEFQEAVSLSLRFDRGGLRRGYNASVFYYDEETGLWTELGGTVRGNQITVEVHQFARFAVFAVEQH